MSRATKNRTVMGDNAAFCSKCGAIQRLFADGPMGAGAFFGLLKGFDKDHRYCVPDPERVAKARAFSTPEEWAANPMLRGTSSLTICAALSPSVRLDRRPGTPRDPADFERCLVLVRALGWRDRLPEVASRHPEWAPFVEEWDEFAALRDEEFPSGKAPKLYARIKAINDAQEAQRP